MLSLGVQDNFFLVCNTNFCCEFAAFWLKFCRLIARVLPPYGMSFAMFWCPVIIKRVKKKKKSLLHFLWDFKAKNRHFKAKNECFN